MKQKIIRVEYKGDPQYETDVVLCMKCNLEVGTRSAVNDMGISWYDKYQHGQVHYDCLSDERKKEIGIK
jgi:hypothetical protein